MLRALDSGRTELRVSDVAQLTGLGSSTTSRLLSTLKRLECLYLVRLTVLTRGCAPTARSGAPSLPAAAVSSAALRGRRSAGPRTPSGAATLLGSSKRWSVGIAR
ncbi:helix-turn-helix domain-containing protein [Streptomyces celluloflavus]|uniref:helix-turn-helix domain-containing protein n=1 Tax=Streptomyces celluloflavus TaxID=58344 RepID=UPI00390809ED